MPLLKPKKLSPRGIFVHLLPQYFRKPRHPQQSLPDEPRTMQVPWDVDEVYNRKTFKKNKFLASTMAMYEFGNSFSAGRPQTTTWCVATGLFAPRSQMFATHIFPKALGNNIIELVGGNREIWSASNGLMLPKPAKQAVDDWALIIVPDEPRLAFQHRNPSYRFRFLNTRHPAMSQRLFAKDRANTLPQVTTKELDGKLLTFGNTNRPRKVYLYFQSCCAVWKNVYSENPECDDEADFTKRFLSRISEFWGPEYVNQSKITDIFLFKCRDSHFTPS